MENYINKLKEALQDSTNLLRETREFVLHISPQSGEGVKYLAKQCAKNLILLNNPEPEACITKESDPPEGFGGAWCLEDIIERSKEQFPEYKTPTKKQAREIADDIENSHDASIGINWDVIDDHLREYFEEEGTKEWILTDEACNQYMKEIEKDIIYLFKEDRVIDPVTGETEVFELELNYKDYTEDQLIDACETFGYDRSDIKHWIATGEEIPLMLECIFELEN